MSFYKVYCFDDFRCRIVMRQGTEDRLSQTCFRGFRVRCAGNFNLWGSVRELLEEPLVLKELLRHLRAAHLERAFDTTSIVVAYRTWVGWSSTAPRAEYQIDDLERFDLNRKGWALRVKRSRRDLLAPLTEMITFVFEFKDEERMPTAVIHSIYPGEDIGEITGNVTERENVVFFDWCHPGT